MGGSVEETLVNAKSFLAKNHNILMSEGKKTNTQEKRAPETTKSKKDGKIKVIEGGE